MTTTTAAPRAILDRVGRAPLRGAVALTVLLVGMIAISLLVGAGDVSVGEVGRTLVGADTGTDGLIVTEIRLPRTVIAVVAGAALGVAGVLAQGLTLNPIAEPGVLGLNSGASLAVVLAIATLGIDTLTGYVWFGFLGAALAAVTVALVAGIGRRRQVSPATVALAGAALAAGLGSVTTVLLLTDPSTFDDYRFWQIGSVAGRSLSIATQVAPFVAVGLIVAFTCGQRLNALALGDDVATSFGRNVGRDRAICAVALVILSGAATAAAGPIGFLGLAVPHLVRWFAGPDHRVGLWLAALAGPSLLLAADVIGRVIAPPGEVQAGVVTAVIGAPIFVALIRRRRFLR